MSLAFLSARKTLPISLLPLLANMGSCLVKERVSLDLWTPGFIYTIYIYQTSPPGPLIRPKIFCKRQQIWRYIRGLISTLTLLSHNSELSLTPLSNDWGLSLCPWRCLVLVRLGSALNLNITLFPNHFLWSMSVFAGSNLLYWNALKGQCHHR
jgi:hypothetical protein